MSMNRRQFIRRLGQAAGFMGLSGCSFNTPAADKPNVLFIFADDQAFDTINALGYEEVQTPNLDRLVKSGVTFTHAYNQGAWHGAVCVASRTMLNTGRFLWDAQKLEPELKQEQKHGRFWSQYMKSAGYETYMSGKWHVKIDPQLIFDHVLDVRPGMPNQTPEGYDRPHKGKDDVWKPWDTSKEGYWKGGKHWSEVLGDNAEKFINDARNKENPFFMYLAFNAPHDPRQSPKTFVEKYPVEEISVPENYLDEYPYKDAMGCSKDLRDERLAPFPRTKYAVKVHRQEYYAIITHMDKQVGRILDALEASGKAENTVILFTADHGLAIGHHGLMGKQNMFDHSIRVPLFVSGKGIPQNVKIDTPVYLQDIMPSALEIAGVVQPEQVRFKSLMPLLDGKQHDHYDSIYGGYMNLQRMICDGQYKLIYYPKIEKNILYDLVNDPLEMKNIADDPAFAAVVSRLQKQMMNKRIEYGDPALD